MQTLLFKTRQSPQCRGQSQWPTRGLKRFLEPLSALNNFPDLCVGLADPQNITLGLSICPELILPPRDNHLFMTLVVYRNNGNNRSLIY